MLGQRTNELGCTAMAMYTVYVPNTPCWSVALPQRHVLAGLVYSPNATAGVERDYNLFKLRKKLEIIKLSISVYAFLNTVAPL